jgi:hypothetical protein
MLLGCYAIYCGFILIVTTSILLAPLLHRLLHKLHLEKTGKADE